MINAFSRERAAFDDFLEEAELPQEHHLPSATSRCPMPRGPARARGPAMPSLLGLAKVEYNPRLGQPPSSASMSGASKSLGQMSSSLRFQEYKSREHSNQ